MPAKGALKNGRQDGIAGSIVARAGRLVDSLPMLALVSPFVSFHSESKVNSKLLSVRGETVYPRNSCIFPHISTALSRLFRILLDSPNRDFS